ncbi:MAG: T9SS type A sorting domain-containing protein, partial [Bacteroidota bacterium]
ILAGAGREGGLNSTRTGEIYKYDLVNNSWKLSSKLPNAVFGPLVLKLSNNHILLAGGGEGEEPPRVSRQILLEDNSKFLPIFNAQLLSDRVCNGFIQWDSTRVLSVGGVTELGPGLNFTRTCEWINFKTGEVTYAPQLNVERLTFATVSIPQFDSEGKYIDSKVYAIGGFGIDSRNITSIEVLEKSSKPANVFEVETVDGTCNKHQFVITKGSEDVITTKLDTALSNNVSLRTLESTSERIVIECSLQDESVFGYYSVYISNSLGASVRLHDTITSNSVIALLKTSGSPEPNDIIPVSISISPKSTPYSSSAKTGFDSLILFLHYSPSEIDFFKNISSPLGFKNWDWNFINNFSNGAITLSGKGNPVFDSAQIDLSAMVFLSKDYKSGKEIPVFLDSAYCYSSNISCFTTFANNESGLFKSICFETGRKVKFGGDYSIHGLPNPANEKFTLEYQVAFDGNSKIRLVNSFGVETYIRDGFLKEGSYSEIINTTALSSGLYYIIIESGAYSSKIPLMVLH